MGEKKWTALNAQGKNKFTVPDEVEMPFTTVWLPLMKRAQRLPEGEGRDDVIQYLQSNMPMAIDPFTPEEAGTASMMINRVVHNHTHFHNDTIHTPIVPRHDPNMPGARSDPNDLY